MRRVNRIARKMMPSAIPARGVQGEGVNPAKEMMPSLNWHHENGKPIRPYQLGLPPQIELARGNPKQKRYSRSRFRKNREVAKAKTEPTSATRGCTGHASTDQND